MFNLLFILCTDDEAAAPKCFMPTTILRGDSQSLTLTLILEPDVSTQNCNGANNTRGIAQIVFAEEISGVDNEIVTAFTFLANEINTIVFDLSPFGFTVDNFLPLYMIKNAEYIIKLDILREITGPVN